MQEHSNRVLDHLTDAEKLFLFGAIDKTPQFEIAHLKHPRRRKRSIYNRQPNQDLELIKKTLDLKLSPRNTFLDPQFLVVRRWANNTEPVVDHSDDEVDSCYYRSQNAALYVCNDVRGVIKADNESHYFIHPLPERFHNDDGKHHVIVKRSPTDRNNNDQSNQESTCVESTDLDKFNNNPSQIWTKHRRKREARQSTIENERNSLEKLKLDLAHRNRTISTFINKLDSIQNRQRRAVLPAIFVETAVFVDRDLYKHMTVNFPKDTERELIRFVLAMINAVQLLYHDSSLGRPVNFILKRLEILHEDPANLKRPHDIDRFLSNFCTWQRLENPPGDTDPLHWDHALILTGLDLYVVSKNGKVSSQVVGLAPVAGMCTVTSSCTVNEGRHFESVYVVAHEIGHNLGMRHDGPLADNGCDPSAYIMSPTLGSGKITWSQCSRTYLQKFLDTIQSRCLLDHGNSAGQLDHSAEGILPGERFDADQQCMLKYGRGSRHSASQSLEDICRDLHCQRERHTWTSHPALEGTKCGHDMYCRGGECVERYGTSTPLGSWGRWGGWSECASSCLLDERHSAAASGIAVATRRCNRFRHDSGSSYCSGYDKKYQTCNAQQCNNVPRLTVREFADQICRRAREVDPDLIGTGLQRMDSDDVSSSCAVWCDTRGGGYKSRGWTLPDGARCSRHAPQYCIAGSCQVSVYTVRYKSRGWTLPDGARCSRHAPQYCIAGSCQVSVYTVRYKSRGWTLPDGARCSRHAPQYCIAGSCQVSVYTVRYKSRGWTLPDGARCSRHAPQYCIAGSCQVSVYTVRYKSRGWTLPDGARCSRHAPQYCIAGSCQVSVYTVRYKSRGWTLPDGARCSRHAPQYCIAGSCQVSVYTVRYKSRGWTLPDGARCSRHAPQYCIAGSCQVSVYTVRYKSRGWTLPDGARCSRHAPQYCIAGSCQVSVYTVRYKSRGWTLPDGARCSRHAPQYCIAGSCQVSVYTVRYKSRGWTLPDGARCSRHAPQYCIAGSCQVSVYTVRYKSRGWTLPDGARCSRHAPQYCIAGSCQVSVYTVRYKSRGWTLPDGARCSRHAPQYCIAGSCLVSVYTVRYKSRGWTLPDGARCSRHAPQYCIAGSCQVSVYTVRYKSRGWTLPDGARCPRHAPQYCIAGSCQVSVYTVRYKSRGWTLPDGTRCSRHAPQYCIAGSCQKFSCSPHADSQFSLTPSECEWEALQLQTATPHTSTKSSGTWRRAVGSQWRAVSGCHYHCVSGGSGVRLVRAAGKQTTSIQLCRPDTPSARLGCSQRKTPYQYATMVCTKYKERVRRLSGLGMQISPALEDPDRPCRVACQDAGVSHRFYLVHGQEGWFPLGTPCGGGNASYCVSGKCLEFGPDNTPLSEMVFTLPLLNRTTHSAVRRHSSRHRRSLQREKVVVTATLKQSHLDHIIKHLNFTENKNEPILYYEHIPEHIEVDFNNPIHIAPEESMFGKIPKPRWDRQVGTLSQYTRV
ncbi:unnamed protein product [Plutella xylostella]|uniref:(diamondback moth) hypothetical protein n=1 Tax=Plutella xylostella TaxID=51655 RepID=A0A8S4FK19_PLUXY|nr:unnamed protein product [Plutella xylostella]